MHVSAAVASTSDLQCNFHVASLAALLGRSHTLYEENIRDEVSLNCFRISLCEQSSNKFEATFTSDITQIAPK